MKIDSHTFRFFIQAADYPIMDGAPFYQRLIAKLHRVCYHFYTFTKSVS